MEKSVLLTTQSDLGKTKIITINDSEYGLKRLERKVERLKSRLQTLENKDLSSCGCEELGRIKEAIYIYEDMIDFWKS